VFTIFAESEEKINSALPLLKDSISVSENKPEIKSKILKVID
jgi:hypothetical protein